MEKRFRSLNLFHFCQSSVWEYRHVLIASGAIVSSTIASGCFAKLIRLHKERSLVRTRREIRMLFLNIFLEFSIFISSAYSAKFLLLPYNVRSHYLVMKKIAEELVQRDHQVVLLAFQSKDLSIKTHPNLTIVTCAKNDAIGNHKDLKKMVLRSGAGMIGATKASEEIVLRTCECIFHDKDLLKEFKTSDVMLSDIQFSCGSALQELLNIPRRVTFTDGLVSTSLRSSINGIPLPLSYIPHLETGLPNKMNFIQRVVNVVHSALYSIYFYHYRRVKANAFKNKYHITTFEDYRNYKPDNHLAIVQTDFALSYARPLPPGVFVVGPLSPEPAKPLHEDLNQFMNDAGPEGVVVVTFGSEVEAEHMGQGIVDKMMKAFGQVKQRVLWKLHAKQTQQVPQNVKILEWIPQNDVLGHVNTRVFVTHVGHNGMFEAAYHGVPMVCTPSGYDQFDNAQMVEAAGLGIAVDIRSISAEKLTKAIEKVIQNPRSNATRVSRLLQDRRRTPLQEAADRMEYILRHDGAKHLRPAVFDVHWYQYFLLDVIAFLVVILTIVVMTWVYLARCILDFLFRRFWKIKTE